MNAIPSPKYEPVFTKCFIPPMASYEEYSYE